MILFWYVLKQFFKMVAATILLAVFLFILFDFLHKSTTYFAKFSPSPQVIFRFYLAQLPFQVMQALPIASLLSSVSVMMMLSGGNEITAMRAAGMGPLRVASPIIAGGLILSLIHFSLSEWVLPISSNHVHHVKAVLIEKKIPSPKLGDTHWIKNKNQILYFGKIDHEQDTIEHIKLIELSKNFSPQKIFYATKGRLLSNQEEWELENSYEIAFNMKAETIKSSYIGTIVRTLPLEPKKLAPEIRMPDELSTVQLGQRIARGRKYAEDVLPLEIAWHVKIAYSFASFVIALIGIRFGYRSERSFETIRSLLLAIGLGMSYWFILSAFRALASSGTIPPIIAAWFANIFIISVVCFQNFRKTSQM